MTVFNLTTAFGENGVWLADDGKSVMSEHEEVYETYVQPLVERVVGEELSLSGIEHAMKTSRREWPARVDYSELKFARMYPLDSTGIALIVSLDR